MPTTKTAAATRGTREHTTPYATDSSGRPLSATQAAAECFHDYARERPEMVAMWAFGLGFVLGWKLRLF